MGVLCFGQLTILFLFFVYFTPLCVGIEFESKEQENCWVSIHYIFKLNEKEMKENKSYLNYAVHHLRLPKPNEVAEHKRVFPSEQEENYQYLLYNNAKIGYSLVTAEFAFKYLMYISKNFDKEKTSSPSAFCKGNIVCENALKYFDFVGDDQKALIRHAILNIVITDIINPSSYRNDMPVPDDKHFAFSYLLDIAKNLETNEGKNEDLDAIMKSPFEYCKNSV